MSRRKTPTIQVSSRGKFVGAEEKYLRHVDEDDGDHEIRSPAVHGAQKPAERDLVIENVQAVPRLARRGDIDQSQQNAGEDLQEEQRERRAAKDVPPACGLARNLVQHGVLDRAFELKAALKPGVDVRCGLLHPLHFESPDLVEMVTSLALFESVGIWPASICNSPETICQL